MSAGAVKATRPLFVTTAPQHGTAILEEAFDLVVQGVGADSLFGVDAGARGELRCTLEHIDCLSQKVRAGVARFLRIRIQPSRLKVAGQFGNDAKRDGHMAQPLTLAEHAEYPPLDGFIV